MSKDDQQMTTEHMIVSGWIRKNEQKVHYIIPMIIMQSIIAFLLIIEKFDTDSTNRLLQLPNDILIHTLQLLQEKDIYNLQKTCKILYKIAKEPNIIQQVTCSTCAHINIYTQQSRYNKIKTINFTFWCDCNQEYDILPVINTFPLLETLNIYSYHCAGNIHPGVLMIIHVILSAKRNHGKRNICIMSDDYYDTVDFFKLNNPYVSNSLLNIKSLTYYSNDWEYDLEFFGHMIESLTVMKITHKVYDDFDLSLCSWRGEEEFEWWDGWNIIEELSYYCNKLIVRVACLYECESIDYTESYWDSYIILLSDPRFESLNVLKLVIVFYTIEFGDWIKHLKPWLVLNEEKMGNMGMKEIEISWHYYASSKEVLGESLLKFCLKMQSEIPSNIMSTLQCGIDEKLNFKFMTYTCRM